MSLPLYPIAADAHVALAQLRSGEAKRAAREKEAEVLADDRVAFVTQAIGPLYATEAEARAAYAALLDDSRVCTLSCRIAAPPPRKHKPTQPVFEAGVRWPKTQSPPHSVWQLALSYWKILPASRSATAGDVGTEQARKLRKGRRGHELTPEQILALTETPMTAARPQKALDFGLFDFIPPDNPGIVIADE